MRNGAARVYCADIRGAVAEWLGNGLQIREPRFNSARRLQ